MGVVPGPAQDLTAGNLLEGRGDPPPHAKRGRGNRQAVADPGQGRAIGPEQERGLDRVALDLLDRHRGEIGCVQPALAHHLIDEQPQTGAGVTN